MEHWTFLLVLINSRGEAVHFYHIEISIIKYNMLKIMQRSILALVH